MQPDAAQVSAPESTIQTIKDNADRLGLTWNRKLATVISGLDPVAVSATYDNDTQAIDMTSMIGPLPVGQRVYVDEVPPSGNFIVGAVTPIQFGVRARVTNAQAIPNAVQTTLIWDVIDEESGGNFIAANGTLFTIPVDGLWALHLRTLVGPGGARNFLNFFITTTIPGVFPNNVRQSYVAGESTSSLSTTIPLRAGNTFNASVYQEGGALTASAWLSAFRVMGYKLP